MARSATRVPVISLAETSSAAGRRRVAEQIDRACQGIGFFIVTEHGVATALIEDLRRAAHTFFALPAARKLAASHPDRGINRGYRPGGDETLSVVHGKPGAPDLKEFFHVGPVDVSADPYYTCATGRRYFPENIWPAAPPGFGAAAGAYYRAMDHLVRELMELAAIALGLDEAFFRHKVDRSIGTMRLNYYPPQTRAPLPGQLRASPHTDYGGFTILSGEDVPGGLQVETRSGEWVDVRTAPTELVVNIGDLLMRWTNDRWVSNPHRVVNPPFGGATSAPRLSIAFFNHPNYDVEVECLAAPGEARYPPINSGLYRDQRYAQIGLATSAGEELGETA